MKNIRVEDRQGRVAVDRRVNFVHEHLFVVGEWKLGPQDGLEVLEPLVKQLHRGFKNGEEVGQAEMRYFVHVGIYIDLKGSDNKGNVGCCSGGVDVVVEGFPAHILSVDRIVQLPARYSCHTLQYDLKLLDWVNQSKIRDSDFMTRLVRQVLIYLVNGEL